MAELGGCRFPVRFQKCRRNIVKSLTLWLYFIHADPTDSRYASNVVESRGESEGEWQALYKFDNDGEPGLPFSIIVRKRTFFAVLLLQGEANLG